MVKEILITADVTIDSIMTKITILTWIAGTLINIWETNKKWIEWWRRVDGEVILGQSLSMMTGAYPKHSD